MMYGKKKTDNEIYLLIKYIKSILWRVGKCLSYIEEVRCLKFNARRMEHVTLTSGCFYVLLTAHLSITCK